MLMIIIVKKKLRDKENVILLISQMKIKRNF